MASLVLEGKGGMFCCCVWKTDAGFSGIGIGHPGMITVQFNADNPDAILAKIKRDILASNFI